MSTETDETTQQYFVFGPYGFDIDHALRLIAKTPKRELHHIKVADWAHATGVDKTMEEHLAAGKIPLMRGDVNEEYARTKTDLSVPVIMADIRLKQGGEPAVWLIDGTHRLRRAFVEGVESLPAHLLTFAETRKIRFERMYGPDARRTRS